MPLSDHEQKMLDEMERQLFADDPKLARAFHASPQQRRSRRRIILGLLGVGIGLALLVLAVALPAIWLGVLAFLIMVAGGIAAVTAPSRTTEGEPAEADGRSTAAASQSAFLRRMEERWERRSGPDGPA
ncbi:DUF3040 domain-containing protein [Brachybacterium sp. AOP25-B2-12]|uniref:DUF3040 domain-containing protein n=1 Tax=Brachybacterium sp. AOP25-B2-12 TaxID=3457710 RepID=UPI0040338823